MQCKLGIRICYEAMTELRGFKEGQPEFQLILRKLSMRTDQREKA